MVEAALEMTGGVIQQMPGRNPTIMAWQILKVIGISGSSLISPNAELEQLQRVKYKTDNLFD